MRRLPLALLIGLIVSGCMKPEMPDLFVDQRGVTTRPPPDETAVPDAMVHLNLYQLPPGPDGKTLQNSTIPPDAKPVTSVETLVCYGKRFYCTILQPKYRIEVGGRIDQFGRHVPRPHRVVGAQLERRAQRQNYPGHPDSRKLRSTASWRGRPPRFMSNRSIRRPRKGPPADPLHRRNPMLP